MIETDCMIPLLSLGFSVRCGGVVCCSCIQDIGSDYRKRRERLSVQEEWVSGDFFLDVGGCDTGNGEAYQPATAVAPSPPPLILGEGLAYPMMVVAGL